MIIVEIDVPVMGKKYDFQIDEDVPFVRVKKEVVEMICKKEKCSLFGNPSRLMFWTLEGKEIDLSKSPREHGFQTGSQLLLV